MRPFTSPMGIETMPALRRVSGTLRAVVNRRAKGDETPFFLSSDIFRHNALIWFMPSPERGTTFGGSVLL